MSEEEIKSWIQNQSQITKDIKQDALKCWINCVLD